MHFCHRTQVVGSLFSLVDQLVSGSFCSLPVLCLLFPFMFVPINKRLVGPKNQGESKTEGVIVGTNSP